jgi:hypothetical protein
MRSRIARSPGTRGRLAIWPAVALLLSQVTVAAGAEYAQGRFAVEHGSWRAEQETKRGSGQRFHVQGSMSPGQPPAMGDGRLKLQGTLAPEAPQACLAADDNIFQDSFE